MGDQQEAAIKRAYGIKTWRDFTKEHGIRFASRMNAMSAQARLKLLEQFPAFKDLSKGSVESVTQAYGAMLAADERSQSHFHEASRQQREVLISELGRTDISPEERGSAHERFEQNVQREYEKDSEGKRFRAQGYQTAVNVAAGAIVAALVFAGAKAAGGSSWGHEDDENG